MGISPQSTVKRAPTYSLSSRGSNMRKLIKFGALAPTFVALASYSEPNKQSVKKTDQHDQHMRVEPMKADDESWSLVSKKKPGPKRSVLYIGNLSPDTTEENSVVSSKRERRMLGECTCLCKKASWEDPSQQHRPTPAAVCVPSGH